MMFKAIIFDMDGTLVDSETVWEKAEVAMFKAKGKAYTADIREQVIGLRLDAFFAKLIAIFDLDETLDDLMQELNERILKRIEAGEIEAKQGAQTLIEYVTQQGLPYCIASSSPQSVIEATVKAQGWDTLIPQRYSADAVEHGKPAPDVYLYAAEKLGVAPEECLAIEDSPTGAKSAVAAGMACYVVPDYHTKPEAFKDITPHVFSDLDGILAHLRGQE
jgi:HAD superfamily hydrolase (TIGR01509 family)